MTEVTREAETLAESAERLDAGLAALGMIAGYYRIAADPIQLRHLLALTGRPAGAEDLVRAGKLLGMKSRIIRGVDARRLGAIPLPAMVKLKDGGFVILADTANKSKVRLIDALAHLAKEVWLKRPRG